MLTAPLPPTETHACRSVEFEANPAELVARGCLGVMTIVEAKSDGRKEKRRRYLVHEDTRKDDGGRVFKVTKPGGGEWYWVFLAYSENQNSSYSTCECRGHEAGYECAHVQGLRALCSKKHIYSPFPGTVSGPRAAGK